MKKLCSEELKLLRTLLDLSLNQHSENVKSCIKDNDYYLKSLHDIPFIEKDSLLKEFKNTSQIQSKGKKLSNQNGTLSNSKCNLNSRSFSYSYEQTNAISPSANTMAVSSFDYGEPLTECGENCSLTSLNSNNSINIKPKKPILKAIKLNNQSKVASVNKFNKSKFRKKKNCNNSGKYHTKDSNSTLKPSKEELDNKCKSANYCDNKSNSGMSFLKKVLKKDISENSEIELNAEFDFMATNSSLSDSKNIGSSNKKKKPSYFLKCKCFRSKKNNSEKNHSKEKSQKQKDYFGREKKKKSVEEKEFFGCQNFIEQVNKSKHIIELEILKGLSELEKLKNMSKNIPKSNDKNYLQSGLDDSVLNHDRIYAEIKLQCLEIKKHTDDLSNYLLDNNATNIQLSLGEEKDLKGKGDLRVTKEGLIRDYKIQLNSKKSFLGKDGELHSGKGSILRKNDAQNNNNCADVWDENDLVDELINFEMNFDDDDEIIMDIRALFEETEPQFDHKGDSRAATPQNVQSEEIPSASGSTEIQNNQLPPNNGNFDGEVENNENNQYDINNNNSSRLTKLREKQRENNVIKDENAMMEARENYIRRNQRCKPHQCVRDSQNMTATAVNSKENAKDCKKHVTEIEADLKAETKINFSDDRLLPAEHSDQDTDQLLADPMLRELVSSNKEENGLHKEASFNNTLQDQKGSDKKNTSMSKCRNFEQDKKKFGNLVAAYTPQKNFPEKLSNPTSPVYESVQPICISSCNRLENKYHSLFELDVQPKLLEKDNMEDCIEIKPNYLLHDVKYINAKVTSLQNKLSIFSSRLDVMELDREIKMIVKDNMKFHD